MNELLRMEGIEKSFPGVKALSGVNLQIVEGELHALIGENGAGKSTLMKILAGVHSKDEGKIFIKGKEIEELTPDLAQKMGVGIIYQEFNLFSDLSVAENIFIRREPKNPTFKFVIDDRKLNKMAQEVLDRLDLKINPSTLVKKLSVAEQQMVEIAKALSMNTEILVMDEPTAALTNSEIIELFKVIKDLKNQGVGIVYISHRLEELEEICDRVTILRDGQYIKTMDYKGLSMEDLVSLMVGRSMEDKFPHRKERNIDKQNIMLEVKKMKRANVLNVKDFKLYSGEILGLYGLMGSGRTEFARALFGVDKVEEMDVEMIGKKYQVKSTSEAIKLGLGYLTEDRKKDGLALSQSVEYNVNLPNLKIISSLGVIDDKKASNAATKYVKELSIKTPSINQLTTNLSGGNQQKICIAKWLNRHSKIIIFDEPTRGIDVGAKYEVYELMIKLADMGIGVIMISSELPEIIGISDRVMVMREGEFSGEIFKKDFTEEMILSYAVS